MVLEDRRTNLATLVVWARGNRSSWPHQYVMSVLFARGANMTPRDLKAVEVRTDWFFSWVTFRTVTSGVLNLLPGAKSLARLGHCHLIARFTMMETLATPLCRDI